MHSRVTSRPSSPYAVMSAQSTPGFTRALCAMVTATSLVVRHAHGEHAKAWVRESLAQSPTRALVASLARVAVELGFCQSAMEVVMGTYALYGLSSRFERLYGARKMIGCACASRALSAMFRAGVALAMRWWSRGGSHEMVERACGPYGLTFALLAMYAVEIPALARFNVFGATVSEKAFAYASGAMLAVSDGRASVIAAVCGLFAGYVISCGVGSESDIFVAPEWVARLVGGGAGTTVRVRAATRSSTPRGQAPVRRDVEPSEANVQMLTSMGFDEHASRRALRQSGDDVQRATTVLLN